MNKLLEKITGGSRSIAGMKMLYPLENGVLFEVAVTRVDFREGRICAVCKPANGVGELRVHPEKLVDDTKASRDLYFRKHAASEFRHKNSLYNRGIVGMRSMIERLRSELPKADQAKLDAKRGDAPLSKLNEYSLRELYEEIIRLKFRLDEAAQGD